MDKSLSEIIFWCGYCEMFCFHDKGNKPCFTDGRVSKYICDKCYFEKQNETYEKYNSRREKK